MPTARRCANWAVTSIALKLPASACPPIERASMAPAAKNAAAHKALRSMVASHTIVDTTEATIAAAIQR
jgi:hypothetical protein